MQVSHSFYKHTVKHEVTKMRDILAHAQKYIQTEDANRSSKRGANQRNKRRNLVPLRRFQVEQSKLSTSWLET